MKTNIQMNSNLDAGSGLFLILSQPIKENSDDDTYVLDCSLLLKTSLNELYQSLLVSIKKMFPKSKVRFYNATSSISYVLVDNIMLIWLQHYGFPKHLWEVFDFQLAVKVVSSPENTKLVYDDIISKIKESDDLFIHWYYSNNGQTASQRIALEKPKQIKDEFYPNLKDGFKKYIDSFFESDSSLLLLRGEPGTGKTSFIQNLIWQSNVNAMVTYEEQLLFSDGFFIDFLTNKNNIDVLILEDADLLITSRVKDKNPIMSKFLNATDGLVKFSNKKIIITANTVDNSKIDSALLRPGRCFDAPIFRSLTYQEVIKACEANNMIIPVKDKSYTLAEMFNSSKGLSQVEPVEKVRFGFGS